MASLSTTKAWLGCCSEGDEKAGDHRQDGEQGYREYESLKSTPHRGVALSNVIYGRACVWGTASYSRTGGRLVPAPESQSVPVPKKRQETETY